MVMNRRNFISGLTALIGAQALEQIPGNRVWSFPSKIVIKRPVLREIHAGPGRIDMLNVMRFHPGMLVDVYSSAGSIRGTFKITSVEGCGLGYEPFGHDLNPERGDMIIKSDLSNLIYHQDQNPNWHGLSRH